MIFSDIQGSVNHGNLFLAFLRTKCFVCKGWREEERKASARRNPDYGWLAVMKHANKQQHQRRDSNPRFQCTVAVPHRAQCLCLYNYCLFSHFYDFKRNASEILRRGMATSLANELSAQRKLRFTLALVATVCETRVLFGRYSHCVAEHGCNEVLWCRQNNTHYSRHTFIVSKKKSCKV